MICGLCGEKVSAIIEGVAETALHRGAEFFCWGRKMVDLIHMGMLGHCNVPNSMSDSEFSFNN